MRTPGLAWAIVVSTTVLSATDIIGTYLPALGDERGWSAGLVGGLLSRILGFNTGVQFMGYYTAVLSVPALLKIFG